MLLRWLPLDVRLGEMKPLFDWLYFVSPALVGVVIGALLSGFLINRFFVQKANLAAAVERVCNRLDGLLNECAEYWSTEFSNDRAIEFGIAEAKIKAGVLHINALVVMINEKYGNVPNDVMELVIELQDSCTGGDFESVNRKADKVRMMRVVTATNALSRGLQKLKL